MPGSAQRMLRCADTTFTGFTRSLGPGIRARRKSRLWLDNCVFRDITLTPAVNGFDIQASAIAAESNVELVIVVRPSFRSHESFPEDHKPPGSCSCHAPLFKARSDCTVHR